MQIHLCVPCRRTRFYKAELQGSAAFDSNLEFGADSQTQVPSSTLPSLGKSSVSINSVMSNRLMTKVWGSEPVVIGADGLPVLESLAHRPKAKVGCRCDSCGARWRSDVIVRTEAVLPAERGRCSCAWSWCSLLARCTSPWLPHLADAPMAWKSVLCLHVQRLLSKHLSAPALQLVAGKPKPGADAVGRSGSLAATYFLAESKADNEAGGDPLTKGDSRSRFLKWVTSQISTSDSQNEEAAAGKQR